MDLLEEHTQALNTAIQNGHKPGHRFSQGVVFCNKCNALLTYISDKSITRRNLPPKFIAGMFGGKCK